MTTVRRSLLFEYRFQFSNNKLVEIQLDLDKTSLELLNTEETASDWTKLTNNQCPNCPLSETDHEYCPVAKNLEGPIKNFGDELSYEEIELEVKVGERKFQLNTSLQKGLSSMIGIIMVSAGCPILDKLRPMVRHHLPAASMEETKYRTLSMYLLAQFMIARNGGTPDWEIKNLSNTYKDIRIINKAFVKRLQQTIEKDAGLNAVVMLNHFAEFVPISIDEGLLVELEELFDAYLNKEKA